MNEAQSALGKPESLTVPVWKVAQFMPEFLYQRGEVKFGKLNYY
jgi:hypothetical protein